MWLVRSCGDSRQVMIRTLVRILCVAIALVQAATAAQDVGESRTTSHSLEPADLEAWLDGMVPYALKTGEMAGVVVVVVKDGAVLLQKGYGFADVQKRLPMDPEQTK